MDTELSLSGRATEGRGYIHSEAREAVVVSAAPTAAVTRGRTEHFVVSYDDSLGQAGQVLADAVLATCERDYLQLQEFFGQIQIGGLPFTVFLGPGSNGARHSGCSDTNITCDVFTGTDADLERSLLVAEGSEVFMASQNAGWDCSASNGEALSRVLAATLYPRELNPPGVTGTFASAGTWLDTLADPDPNQRRPDFVNSIDPSDRNFVSIGCGTLFINWLTFQLGFELGDIVRAGGSPLAETARRLTGWTDAFSEFRVLVALQFPDVPSGLSTDNAFPYGPNVDGTLLQVMRAGPVFVMFGQAKFQIPDDATQQRLFPAAPVIQIGELVLARNGLIPANGTLLREESSPTVWLVEGGERGVAPAGTPGAHVLWDGALAQIPIALGGISGQITDEAGAPLAQVDPVLFAPDGGVTQLGPTGPDGHYETGPLAPGVYRISVEETGFVPANVTVELQPGVLNVIRNFTLIRTLPFTVSGTVVGTSATTPGVTPLVGATVGVDNPSVEVTAGAGGAFSLTFDPGFASSVTVTAASNGFAPSTVTVAITNGGSVIENFVLDALGEITGRVSDVRGGAVTGATVTAGSGSAPTDETGHYALTGVIPGSYDVTAAAPNFQTGHAQITVDAGVSVHEDFVLADIVRGTITGTVTDSDTGIPLGRATIRGGGQETVSGAGGVYTLSDVPSGSVEVTVTHVRYFPQTQQVDVFGQQTVTVDFQMDRIGPPVGD
jgi:Carboxypeptidase regulatory-like domain